jgi:glycosyltransferase involved in cell wall biosynthesis
MMNPRSIAILHYSSPPVVGGVEAVIQAHVEVFLKNGHQVRVIAGEGEASAFSRGPEFVKIPEISSQYPQVIQMTNQLDEGEIPEEFSHFVDQLIGILKPHLFDCDCWIVHNIFTMRFNLPLTVALHRLLDEDLVQNCIAWCHDFSWSSVRSRHKVHEGQPWDLLRTLRPDVKYVVVSKQRRDTLAQLFGCSPREISVVYNGVDYKGHFGLSEGGKVLVDRLDLVNSDLIMLMPVRVTKAKNIEFALHVVKEIKERGVRPKLILTGPPDPHVPDSMTYYQSLLELRMQLDIEEEMRFIYELGHGEEGKVIDLDAVGDLIRVTDLVFMPSHQEGFGMPILEAGLVGTPVVASSIPSVNEIAGEDAMVIGDSETAGQVAERILDWTESNPVYRLRRRVRRSFTWEAIYRQSIAQLLIGSGD